MAEADMPVRSISVSGTVETKTAPDQVVWRIDLTDADEDMREAKARNDEKVASVLALREKLGIEEGEIETGHVSIRRERSRDEQGNRSGSEHYVVHRSVTIRQRDLKRFDEFLDALVSSAEMEVNFSFESSRFHEIRAETRLKALRAAKDKAEAMAQVVGAKLGRALTIEENSVSDRSPRGWVTNNSVSVAPPSSPSVDVATDRFIPGAIDVRETVYATFELE
jgi:uncharacterized protein YggE